MASFDSFRKSGPDCDTFENGFGSVLDGLWRSAHGLRDRNVVGFGVLTELSHRRIGILRLRG